MEVWGTMATRPAAALLTLIGATVIGTVVIGTVVFSMPATAKTELEVTTATDDRYRPGTTTPFIVSISSDGAVSGTITILADGTPVANAQVDVPGGSIEDVVIAVPTMPWQASYSATFDSDDNEDDATVRIDTSPAQGDELVGVLPTLAARDLPEQAPLSVNLGIARYYPIDARILDLGVNGLGGYGQILGTAEDLEALEPAHLEALGRWISDNGGILLVDEEVGTVLPFESERQLSPTDVAFGLGTIRFTDGRAGSGNFDGLVQPSASQSVDDFPWLNSMGSVPTTTQLASDAGIRVPAITGLVITLLGYTILVGPFLWLILKRRRREPALWVAIPVIALLASLGIYVAGRQLRSTTQAAHATVVADLPTGRIVSTQVLVTSPNGSREGIRLAEGWHATPSNPANQMMFEEGFGMGGGNVVGSGIEADGELTTRLDPGGIAVLSAEGSEARPDQPSFAIDLRPDDTDLVGTITNLTSYELSNIIVTSGSAAARLQTLGAGESKDVTLRNPGVLRIQGDAFAESLMRGDPWTPNDGDENPGVLQDFLARKRILRNADVVMAIGWTRQADGPVETTRGTPITEGRTAFVTAARLYDTTTTTPTILRGHSSSVRPTDQPPANVCVDISLTWSTPVPETAEPGAVVVMDVDSRAVAALDVWNGTEWVPAGMAEADGGRAVLVLPFEAYLDGPVYSRATFSCDVWGVRDPMPTVRVASAADEGDSLKVIRASS